jgi:hypothetical protein
MKEGTPRLGVALSAAITLLLGMVIMAHWPVSILWDFFLGFDMIF